jgi:hypothetical protein
MTGAPECYRADDILARAQLLVKPSADIWSLGCIYSDAARWIANGKRGTDAYRGERLAETSQIPDFGDGDCFHNGQQRLRAVGASHETTIRSLRKGDTITQRVLDVMVEEMLNVKADARPSADNLWSKATRILNEAQEELQSLNARRSTRKVPTLPASQRSPPPVLPPGWTDGLYPRPSLKTNDYPSRHKGLNTPTTTPSNEGSLHGDLDQKESSEELTDGEEPHSQGWNPKFSGRGEHVRSRTVSGGLHAHESLAGPSNGNITPVSLRQSDRPSINSQNLSQPPIPQRGEGKVSSWTIAEALDWKAAMKDAVPCPQPLETLLNRLKGRDHVRMASPTRFPR